MNHDAGQLLSIVVALTAAAAIDAEAAAKLAAYKGQHLSLEGLATLAPEATRPLRENPRVHLPSQLGR
jgi:hypothetical protein